MRKSEINFRQELNQIPLVSGRHPFIENFCSDKRVLHVGCVDTGMTRERMERGDLLHQKLDKVSRELWGIDIDEEGISMLESMGFTNLVLGDLERVESISGLSDIEFDVIVVSEVIEHTLNPGVFLKNVKLLMTRGHTKLILTVPNAFNVNTLFGLLKGYELVHPDHNYWFSRYTVGNLARKAGLEITQEYMYTFQQGMLSRRQSDKLIRFNEATGSSKFPTQPTKGWRKRLALAKYILKKVVVNYLYKRSCFWADGIILICALR